MGGMIAGIALLVQIPFPLLFGICSTESDFRNVINQYDGGSPSYGICQIKLDTARMMGFEGDPSDLMIPAVNAYFAAKYIKWQLKRSRGRVRMAIAAYNSGTAKYKNKLQFVNEKYVNKVIRRGKHGAMERCSRLRGLLSNQHTWEAQALIWRGTQL